MIAESSVSMFLACCRGRILSAGKSGTCVDRAANCNSAAVRRVELTVLLRPHPLQCKTVAVLLCLHARAGGVARARVLACSLRRTERREHFSGVKNRRTVVQNSGTPGHVAAKLIIRLTRQGKWGAEVQRNRKELDPGRRLGVPPPRPRLLGPARAGAPRSSKRAGPERTLHTVLTNRTDAARD